MPHGLRALILSVTFLAGFPALAHHAFSGEFDSSKPITLEGVVTRISWENPHVFFYVDVAQPDVTSRPSAVWEPFLARNPWTTTLSPGFKESRVQPWRASPFGPLVSQPQFTTEPLAAGRKILSGKKD